MFSNSLILQWCSFNSLGCNANSGATATINLPISLSTVLSYADSTEAPKRLGDWAKCSTSIDVSTTQVIFALWSFGAWAANGVRVIIIGI